MRPLSTSTSFKMPLSGKCLNCSKSKKKKKTDWKQNEMIYFYHKIHIQGLNFQDLMSKSVSPRQHRCTDVLDRCSRQVSVYLTGKGFLTNLMSTPSWGLPWEVINTQRLRHMAHTDFSPFFSRTFQESPSKTHKLQNTGTHTTTKIAEYSRSKWGNIITEHC